MEELQRKEYPLNYSKEIEHIIDDLAFNKNNVSVLGSMSYKSMFFPVDFDLYEVVKYTKNTPKIFQNKIKKLINNNNYFIGDIKIGEIEEYKLIDELDEYEDYDYEEIKENVERLIKQNILTNEEKKTIKKILKPNLSYNDFLKLKKELRFNILRWTPQDILKGELDFRNKKIKLNEAMESSGLFKLDLIARLENKDFQEFSIIYDLRKNNIRVNIKKINTLKSLEENINFYINEGSYFKALKRLFSKYNYIYKYKNKKRVKVEPKIKKILEILNSDLGILYQVLGDIELLIYLINNYERLNINDIKTEMDNFVNRLSNIYSIKLGNKYLKQLKNILELKNLNNVGKQLENIYNSLYKLLNKEAKKYINI